MVVIPVVLLMGSLFHCSSGYTYSTSIERLKQAALESDKPLTCNKWDCNCTFYQQRGCCCAANEMFQLDDDTFDHMVDLWHRIALLKYKVHELTECSQIAFKATMKNKTDCYGPFSSDIPIPYTNVTLNDGHGYNPALGIFTAPCDGVYFFSFTTYSYAEDRIYYKVQLMKNGEEIASVWEANREDLEDNANQAVVLGLKRGDQVYTQLMNGRKICGYQPNNIFTGYILYSQASTDYDDYDDYDDYEY